MAEDIDALLARTWREETEKWQPKLPLVARSASDKTDDWPYWLVADRTCLNVTAHLDESLRGKLPFVTRAEAETLARVANG